jgi:hypothetical protein
MNTNNPVRITLTAMQLANAIIAGLKVVEAMAAGSGCRAL